MEILSPFAPENLVSRDGFGSPVPRQPAHLHTQAESGAYLRDSSRVPQRRPFIYFKPYTVRLVQSFMFFFVSHLRPMGLNVLGYQPHLLQRCYRACGREGSSHLSPVLALRILLRSKFSTLTTCQPMVCSTRMYA